MSPTIRSSLPSGYAYDIDEEVVVNGIGVCVQGNGGDRGGGGGAAPVPLPVPVRPWRSYRDASPVESPGNYHKAAEDSSRKASVSVSVDKRTQWSPLPSPSPSPSPDGVKALEKTNAVETVDTRPPVVAVNKAVRQDMMRPMTKVGPSMGGGGGRRPIGAEAGFRRSRGGGIVLKTALWFRVLELILCLISYSVMAADKTKGWAGDSFDRYKEYRYCLSVNVIAFLYSGAQACYLSYQLMTGNRFVHDHIHNYFDFFMDQAVLP